VSFTRVEILTSEERFGRLVRTCPSRECPLWTRTASLRSTVPGCERRLTFRSQEFGLGMEMELKTQFGPAI